MRIDKVSDLHITAADIEKAMNYFTAEEWNSDFYRFRNSKSAPKKVKFFVFSNRHMAQRIEMYDKRVKLDPQGCPLDLDYVYLKERLFDKFAAKIEDEDHLEIYQNRSVNEVWGILDNMKKCDDLVYFDCFFFIFLTYIATDSDKDGGMKISFHNSKTSVDQIWEKVGEINHMNGIPKVFLVQADDVRLMMDPRMITKSGGGWIQEQRKIPTDADRMSIVCTIPGKGFVERKDDPSFMIQAFVEALDENDDVEDPLDLLSLTVLINQRVKKLIKNSTVKKVQDWAKDELLSLPCTTSTLRKLLVINPISWKK